MELTLATLQDEQLAYDFVCELEEQDFSREVFHNAWIKSMEDDTIQHYFLKVDNDFVGFCSLRRIYHLHHCAKVAQIEEFIVRKEYR
ncbi:MAG: GNAT family N-acetyltransferase, partial [Longicatena sp.]